MQGVFIRAWLFLSIFLHHGFAFSAENPLLLTKAEQQWIQSHGVVSVGAGSDWAPFDFVLDSGEYGGLSWDYLQAIGDVTGLRFKAEVALWYENLEKAKHGGVDVLPAAFLTEDRKTFLNFSRPYYRTVEYFFIREDIPAASAEDMNGMTVAIPKGFAHIEFLEEHYPDIHILLVDSIGDAIDAVIQGRAELLYETYISVDYLLSRDGINTIKPFLSSRSENAETVHIAVRKDLPLLHSIINKGLAALNYEKRREIDRRWLTREAPEASEFSVSKAEERWLDNHRHLRFGGDPNWLPFEAFDKEGAYIGIVSDYLSLIEQRLGTKFDRVKTDTWLETIDFLEQKKIDVISETYESPLGEHVVFTKSYLSSPIVVVMRDDAHYVENISQIRRKKIALIQDYGYVDEIQQKYVSIPFLSVEDIQEGLTSVSTGKIDALIATLSQVSYHISDLGIHNVRIVGKTEFQTKLAFGVRKEYAELVPIINRAIDSIGAAERQQVLDGWGREKFASRVDYRYLWRVILVALVIFLAILVWNRKLAREVALRRQAEDQTQTLIDSIPAQVFVTDLEGNLLTSNPQFVDDFRFSQEELDGFNVDDLYTDFTDKQDITDILLSGKQVKNKVIRLQRKGQKKTHALMLSVIPIRYLGKPSLLAIAMDLNERLEIEKQLRAAKEAAEVATRTKSEFLANMSHEIRTPMNAIIGFTELLEREVEDEKIKSYVKTIQSSSNNLLLIVNDILDLSKIESGAIDIVNSPAKPRALFDELYDIFKLSIQNKNLRMFFDISPSIPDVLLMDLPRLRQVLINLLGNAIKFTDTGYVKLSAGLEAENKKSGKFDLKIEVEDTGIGIPEDQVDSVFDKFQQVNDEASVERGGTGLGLSISQRLIQLMGGELSIKSVYGSGTTVTVLLKGVGEASISQLPEAENQGGVERSVLTFHPATVLVVDDIDVNRRLVKETLAGMGLNFIEAQNGKEAVQVCAEGKIDLVLMDLRMPVMGGYEAAEIIKRDAHAPPIVALTASVMKSDLDQIRSAFFDGYIRKPLTREILLHSLVDFLPYVAEDKPVESFDRHKMINISELPTGLKEALVAMSLQCTKICESNNLAETSKFAEQLRLVATEYKNDTLIARAKILKQNTDNFDISAVDSNLKELKELIVKLGS